MTVSGRAAPCIRAATLTVSPSASTSREPSPPMPSTMARPVLMPTRMCGPSPSSLPNSRRNRGPASATAAIISRPAWTARTASSSWAAGAPKMASRPSPISCATVPPYRSIGTDISASVARMAPLQSSGSMRSARAVESTTSAKSTVTRRRSAAAVGLSVRTGRVMECLVSRYGVSLQRQSTTHRRAGGRPSGHGVATATPWRCMVSSNV